MNLHPWIPEGVREPDYSDNDPEYNAYRWGWILLLIYPDNKVMWGESGEHPFYVTTTSKPFPQELFEYIKL